MSERAEQVKKLLGGTEEPWIWVSFVPGTDRCVIRVFSKDPRITSNQTDSEYIYLEKDELVKL